MIENGGEKKVVELERSELIRPVARSSSLTRLLCIVGNDLHSGCLCLTSYCMLYISDLVYIHRFHIIPPAVYSAYNVFLLPSLVFVSALYIYIYTVTAAHVNTDRTLYI